MALEAWHVSSTAPLDCARAVMAAAPPAVAAAAALVAALAVAAAAVVAALPAVAAAAPRAIAARAGARCVGMSSSLVDAAEGFTLGAWSAFFAAGREPCWAVRAAAPLDIPPAAPACVAPAA